MLQHHKRQLKQKKKEKCWTLIEACGDILNVSVDYEVAISDQRLSKFGNKK